MNARQVALDVLLAVIGKGQSATAVLPAMLAQCSKRDRALAQALVYGVLRSHHRLNWLSNQLLKKKFGPKDLDLQLILEMALHQLFEMRVPDHAAVNSAIEQVNARKKSWAKGVVNAVLRTAIREQESLLDKAKRKEVPAYSAPIWLINQLKNDWPKHWRDVLDASNQAPPMALRVNAQKHELAHYQSLLDKAGIVSSTAKQLANIDQLTYGLCLDKPVDVDVLPDFSNGGVSVQDFAPQFSAHLLNAQNDERVLDACAAPGGKTCHILERAPNVQVTAVDVEPARLTKVHENLKRLNLNAELISADICDVDTWWNGKPFDKILLDVPCSATGVIRRHPDIKVLRKSSDIQPLVDLQAKCLDAIWHTLKQGGTLLYATCSVFKQENEAQIKAFLARTPNAVLAGLDLGVGVDTGFGHQLLPSNTLNTDGFFYAKLTKQAIQ